MRPSKYLLEKVANFDNTLAFFLGNERGTRHPLNEKRLVFLAQIDFWEWEMETLIYSFTNYCDRSKAWVGDPEDLLRKNGILVKTKVVEAVRKDRAWKLDNDVAAPMRALNECIDKWNGLLDECERSVMVAGDELRAFGFQGAPDLGGYRKAKLPEG